MIAAPEAALCGVSWERTWESNERRSENGDRASWAGGHHHRGDLGGAPLALRPRTCAQGPQGPARRPPRSPPPLRGRSARAIERRLPRTLGSVAYPAWLGLRPYALLAAVALAFLSPAGITQLTALRPLARRVPFGGGGIRRVVIAVVTPVPRTASVGVDVCGHVASPQRSASSAMAAKLAWLASGVPLLRAPKRKDPRALRATRTTAASPTTRPRLDAATPTTGEPGPG